MSELINTHSSELHNAMLASIKSKLSVNKISGVFVSEDEVCEAISSLRTKNQIYSLGLFSQHLKFSFPVIAHDMSNSSLHVFDIVVCQRQFGTA